MLTLNDRPIRGYAGADVESAPIRGRSMAFLGLPNSRRHAGLALCWLLVGGLGVALLTGSDPAGVAYLVVAVVGYLFLHSRWLGSTLGGLVIVSGLYQLSQGNTAGAVVSAIGVLAIALAVDIVRLTAAVMSKVATLEPVEALFDGLRVRTIGQFRIEVGDQDLTAELLDRPILAFIWMHLLARAIRNPAERMLRSALGDEVAPGLPSETQGDRLRGHIHDLQRKLPSELTATVDADRKTIRVLLEGVRLDVEELQRFEQSVGSGQLIGVEAAGRIRNALDQYRWGEFLPGFEELEHKVTGGRGVAGALLAEVRAMVNTSRGNLAEALVNHYLALGTPEAAIPVLEAALRLDANREDLARLLVQVHVRCGHTATAATVTQQFGLSGEA